MTTTTTRAPSVHDDGQYRTVTGSKYDDERHPNETNKLIRAEIKQAVKDGHLPDVKYSVTRSKGSWSSVYITVLVEDPDAWALKSRAGIGEDGDWHGGEWTEDAKRAGTVLGEIASQYVRNTTDIQTDYFAGGYVHLFVTEPRFGPGGGLCLPRWFPRDL